MKHLFWFVFLSASFQQLNGQSNLNTMMKPRYFPELIAKTLTGRKVIFPKEILGRKSILVLAFENKGEYQNCQMQANQWAIYWEEKLKAQKVAFYEIPMMSGKYAWASFWVDAGMRSGISKEKHDMVACFYGDKSIYNNLLTVNDLSLAHVFVLNENGEILYATSDLPVDDAKKAIEQALRLD